MPSGRLTPPDATCAWSCPCENRHRRGRHGEDWHEHEQGHEHEHEQDKRAGGASYVSLLPRGRELRPRAAAGGACRRPRLVLVGVLVVHAVSANAAGAGIARVRVLARAFRVVRNAAAAGAIIHALIKTTKSLRNFFAQSKPMAGGERCLTWSQLQEGIGLPAAYAEHQRWASC